MPVLDVIRSDTWDDNVIAFLKACAVMAWPHDETRQRQYVFTNIAIELKDGGPRLRGYFDGNGGERALALYPSVRELDQAFETRLDACFVAGRMLQIIELLSRSTERIAERASVNATARMIEGNRAEYLEWGFTTPKNSNDVKTAWANCRDVAHLCAAFFQVEGPLGPWDGREWRMHFLHDFFALAAKYEDFGTAYKAARARQSLLDPETIWHVPDSFRPPANAMHPTPLTDRERALITSYRAPKLAQ